MNENTLKIIGTVSLPEPLEMGTDIVVAGRMSVVSIEKKDLENGDFEYCHKAKISHVEVVNKLGATVKGVKKGSKSQVLRLRILEHGDEEYYQQVMSKIIDNLEDIIAKYDV